MSNIKINHHKKNTPKPSYNFNELIIAYPKLKQFVFVNKYNTSTINFADNNAVLALNTAILLKDYKLSYWSIPFGYLCPPIPGRANYINKVAELLGKNNNYKIPMNAKVKCLDVGVGANCIYPIIGRQVYGWHFVGSDIDKKALKSAQKIIDLNENLKNTIELRHQNNKYNILKGIINNHDKFDLIVCNPPFHSSEKEAQKASKRKIKNLKLDHNSKLNFGGVKNELWCNGGEKQFIASLIKESELFGKQCYWFTTLVSKKENLHAVYANLKQIKAFNVKTINIGKGNKLSRIVAWTFLTLNEQEEWMHNRWRTWITEKN